MTRIAHIALATALATLAGCASEPPPGVNLDILAMQAQAGPNADPAHNIDLMREQGERFAHVKFTDGNKVDLLVNGDQSFAALESAIKSARTRIDMESYEFDDEAGTIFADLLIKAHARGVDVNLIHDAWGTNDTSNALFDRIRVGGVRVLEYNPIAPNARVPISINARDHRKLLCVDGRIAITGGVNISRVYLNKPSAAAPSANSPKANAISSGETDPNATDPNDEAWRDTDVRITGPVVAQFEHYFMETWRAQKGPPLSEPPKAPGPFPGGLRVQAIDGAPDNGRPLIYRTLLAAITLSQHSVHLTTGFFVPTPDLLQSLIAAAKRGVDVQIIVPARTTSDASVAAGRARYGDLLEAGVKIHEFEGRILHAKTAVIDGAWAAIGSSNLDWRSTVWNNEIDAIILGPEFGTQMETLFAADVATSSTVTMEAWRDRGIAERVRELRAKMVEQLL
jgi:cardiolipin synthase